MSEPIGFEKQLAAFGVRDDGESWEGDERGYIDGEGVSWPSIEQVLGIKVLGFCGCGDPGGTLLFVHEALQFVADNRLREGEDWRARYAASAEWWNAHGGEAPRHLLAYLLDDKGLTEHGTSINGAWLTDKGEAFKDLLAHYVSAVAQNPNPKG